MRELDESLVLGAELPETSFSPTPYVSLFGDCQAEERAASDVIDRLSIETLNVLRSTGNLDTLADAKLSLEASSPCIYISFVSEHKRVMLTACNLNDSLVPQRLKDSWCELTARPTMTDSALHT